MSPLEQALNDGSVYVQEESCTALLRMTNYSYSAPNCNPPEEPSPATNSTAQSLAAKSTISSYEPEQMDRIYSWLKSHLIFPSPEDLQNKNGGE